MVTEELEKPMAQINSILKIDGQISLWDLGSPTKFGEVWRTNG